MKEIPQLLETWRGLQAAGEDAVLATVVKVEGSSYRNPGARMLIDANGGSVGTISGGCLESHVVKRAWWLTAREPAVVCRYDTSADEDAQWAFGLGCNGVVHVLLERLSAARGAPQLEALALARATMRAAATAVVIATSGCGVRVGERLLLGPDGGRAGALGAGGEGSEGGEAGEVGAFAARVAQDLAAVLREGCGACRRYAVGAGWAEVFLELLPPPLRLVVFGAGHDAVPVVRFAKALGWHVTVADGRAHYARRERFPEADAVLVSEADDPLRGCGVSADAAVVLMTHSLEQDRVLLGRLLRAPPRYLGQLGPRARTERLLAALAEAEPALRKRAELVHAPIGLDIGAENPEEIALAIVGEIRAAFAGRSGAMLRHHAGPIHAREGVGEGGGAGEVGFEHGGAGA